MEDTDKRFLAKNLLKMMNFYNFFFFAFILSSCVSNKSALKSFNSAEYSIAAEKFQKVVKDNDPKTNFLIAEAFRKSNQIWEAESYYSQSINEGFDNELAYYYLIISLKANNKYDAADSVAKKYLKIGSDETVINLINKESLYIENLKKYPDTSYYKVKNLNAINTTFADYAPSYSK